MKDLHYKIENSLTRRIDNVEETEENAVVFGMTLAYYTYYERPLCGKNIFNLRQKCVCPII